MQQFCPYIYLMYITLWTSYQEHLSHKIYSHHGSNTFCYVQNLSSQFQYYVLAASTTGSIKQWSGVCLSDCLSFPSSLFNTDVDINKQRCKAPKTACIHFDVSARAPIICYFSILLLKWIIIQKSQATLQQPLQHWLQFLPTFPWKWGRVLAQTLRLPLSWHHAELPGHC